MSSQAVFVWGHIQGEGVKFEGGLFFTVPKVLLKLS